MPTERNPNCVHLSASSISAFKACPTRYRLAYREGIRRADDSDALRVGSNWHALHEVYRTAHRDSHDADAALTAAVEHLNDRYQTIPNSKTPEEWAVEQQVLINSFVGYLWYYQEDRIEVLANEVPFDLCLNEPRTGLPIPVTEALRVGKIDEVIERQGMIGTREFKSTSRSIDDGADYWDIARKDTQVSMYALAFRDLANAGQLPEEVTSRATDLTRFGSTLYDVWRKPSISPAKLTQKDTRTFIDTSEYCGQTFDVVEAAGEDGAPVVRVNEGNAEVFPGKKDFAIRETPEMFGARLLADIQERPEHYFRRKEISRTDKDLAKFRTELFNLYIAQGLYDKTKCWFENEKQCRATYPCEFIPICYGPGADAVCDGKTTPQGFKRIFVDLTTNGDLIDDC